MLKYYQLYILLILYKNAQGIEQQLDIFKMSHYMMKKFLRFQHDLFWNKLKWNIVVLQRQLLQCSHICPTHMTQLYQTVNVQRKMFETFRCQRMLCSVNTLTVTSLQCCALLPYSMHARYVAITLYYNRTTGKITQFSNASVDKVYHLTSGPYNSHLTFHFACHNVRYYSGQLRSRYRKRFSISSKHLQYHLVAFSIYLRTLFIRSCETNQRIPAERYFQRCRIQHRE